ncbi:MAG: adenylyltransferase, partial [Gammaproteobacteria bacterium]|nr:adenylyltransferase [Gammaproteobacteria bacterium]
MAELIKPHGGDLVDLYATGDTVIELQKLAQDLPAWTLSQRQICDLELLLNGAFSPLEGFMNEADYNGVVENMRLADGTLWPMPTTLDVSEKFAEGLSEGSKIALRDQEGVLIAVMEV